MLNASLAQPHCLLLGALLKENDIDSRIHTHASEFSIPGEETDAVYAAIMELMSICLLTRTSAVDQLDANSTYL